MSKPPIHPQVRIGHIRLKVSDLGRATDFYRDVLGFDFTLYDPDEASVEAAWLSAGGYHHHVALNTFHSAGGVPQRQNTPASITSPSSTRAGGSWPRPSSAF